MSFGAPGYLVLLGLVPLAAAVIVAGAMWRRRAAASFGVEAWRVAGSRWAAAALALVALAATALAAARPQAGARQSQVDQRGIELVIVLDVSQSMLAGDEPPTRLARAQQEAAALLDRMRGDRVGLVIFAGTPFTRSPLTSDLRALREVLGGVDAERALVRPGSDLGAAVQEARRLLTGSRAERAILIISDGEDHGAGVADAVASVRADGVAIYAAGVGTVAGSPVQDPDPATGLLRPRVGDDGAPVLTKLDEPALAAIADAGGGRYVRLSGDGHPLAALAADFAGLRQTRFGTATSAVPIERFQLVAAAALIALLAATLLSLAPGRIVWRRALRLLPLAGAGMLVAAVCSADAASVNRRGNRQYAAGDYDAAISLYRTAQALAPSRPEPYYNAGNAYDRDGDFNAAIEQTLRALAAGGEQIRAQAEYALGNHNAASGRLDDAREAYRRALLADPADPDAKHNLEVIDRLLHPSATATPTPPETPVPGEPSRPGGTPGPGQPGTPKATASAAGEGTPRPSDARDLPQDELQRLLQDALAGIDRQFTEEEALRVLDLLDEANRRAGQQPSGSGGSQPDY